MPLSPTTLAQLTDDDPQTRERAALLVYDSAQADSPAGLAEAMHRSVEHGNRSAAALLVLARFPAPGAAESLRALRSEVGSKGAKLRDYGPVVPLTLVIDLALARLGDRDAKQRLVELTPKASETERRFLLEVLRDIEDPALLQSIAQWLDDRAAVPDGVPSGATPTRRLTDTAVDALVQRFSLQPSFELRPSARYSDSEIGEIKQLVQKLRA